MYICLTFFWLCEQTESVYCSNVHHPHMTDGCDIDVVGAEREDKLHK